MSLKATARSLGWRVAPEHMADRARAYQRDLRVRVGTTELARRFCAAHGGQVLGGPIEGLCLCMDRLSEIDAPTAKLLGTYEKEIHPALSKAVAAPITRLINLGSADGYFAVGVARAAAIPVDAFDMAPSARSLTRQTAAINGVNELVTIHGTATTTKVAALPLEDVLVLCDIDGPERDLFTRDLVQQLGTAWVIIELHHKVNPDVEVVLVERFAGSHHVSVVEAEPRVSALHTELEIFEDDDERDHAINELRYRYDGLRWLVAEPR